MTIIKLFLKKLVSFPRGAHLDGEGVYISPLADLKHAGRIRLGKGVVLEKHARVCANGAGSRISIGEYTTVYPYALLKTNGGNIDIGKGCSVNDYAVLYGYGGLRIGDDVHIASHAVIVASEHDYGMLGCPDFSSSLKARGVNIGGHVWIGTHAVILDGVTIGSGSVIGAGAVVTEDIPANSVAVGVPARVIKQRGP